MNKLQNSKQQPVQIEVGKLYKDKSFSHNPVVCVFNTYQTIDRFYNKNTYVKYYHLSSPNHILDDRYDYLELIFEEVKDAL